MESTMSVVNYNPTTKQEINNFTEKIIGEVSNGAINPLELHIKTLAIEKCFKQVREGIKEYVIEDVNKHPEKTFEMFGAKVAKADLGVKYDFNVCSDPILERLLQKQIDISGLIEQRKEFLKSLSSSGMEIVDEETGEVVRVFPPNKESTEGIKVTIK